jgi:DNA-directed RNA polymerase beta subunit
MKALKRQRRLRLEGDLIERALRVVLQDSRDLIQERLAQAAKREQLLIRKDKILHESEREKRKEYALRYGPR